MGKWREITASMRGLCNETLSDLVDKRLFIALAGLVFVIGAITSLFFRDLAENLLRFFIESVRPHIIDRSFVPLVLLILSRNAVALFLMIFLGMVFSIFPILALFANGFIVGAALLYAPLSWWQLLPHGIFEVPAMFFAAAYGIWLGFWPFASGKTDGLRHRLRTCTFAYIRLILPLLVLAGFIEATLISQMR